jgi:hypothetical protein
MQPRDLPTPRLWRVRRVFWLLLAGSMLVTLVPPAFVLWRASVQPLAARACLWPPAPQTLAPIYVYVSLSNPADRTDVHGPWAQLVVHWDMATMSMGTHTVTLHGPSAGTAAANASGGADMFVIALRPTMIGPWWARLSLQTPGRPTWTSEIRFMVGPPSGASIAQAAPARDPCAAAGTV